MSESPKSALLFDITWFISFFLIQVLPFVIPDYTRHPLGFFVFSCLVGGTMILSKKILSISLVGRMLHWFAINVMKPRTDFNHIIWGGFILIFGILSVIFYEKPDSKEIEYINEISRSWKFWLAVVGIFALNILAGVYTAKKHKK